MTWTLANPLVLGQQAYQQGQLDKAVQFWQTALQQMSSVNPQRNALQLNLAEAYQQLGQYAQAIKVLQQAVVAETDIANKALLLSHLSDIFLANREFEQAEQSIAHSLVLAQQANDLQVLAHVLNNQGNLFATVQNYAQSQQAYTQAWQTAAEVGDVNLLSRALLNQIQAALFNQDYSNTHQYLPVALAYIETLPDSTEQRLNLITLGRLALQLYSQLSTPDSHLLKLAHNTLQKVQHLAETAGDNTTASYAYGYLGRLYKLEKRLDEALQLTRKALFLAEQEQAQPIIYRWYAQIASIYQQQNQWEQALTAYNQAIRALQPARPRLASAYRSSRYSFQQFVKPVYVGMVDLLLQNAQRAVDDKQRLYWQRQALQQLELLKGVELEHFFQDFQDNCFLKTPRLAIPNHHLDAGTAALYPLLLPDRLELLLLFPDGTIFQHSQAVPEQTFQAILRDFRQNLVIRSHYRFLEQAWQLYDWLIRPVKAALEQHQIDTLVFVPDNLLRTVPLSALHDRDSKQFLIEQFALVTTPSLYLTPDANHRTVTPERILLAGLSEPVQNFPPLFHVPQELAAIKQLYAQEHTLLQNKDFSVANLADLLQNNRFTMIHIASHGQFNNDPSKTFLLTYDDQLDIRQFEALLQAHTQRQIPIDLLTLSACQTAVGDERAALGLAGMAIKVGVRSTVATLWFIDDTATSELVAAFYQQLKTSISKAKALQNAQRQILAERRFAHPAYWSAFLLIGNWL